MPEPALVAVMGPTGSGKTAVAECVAERLDAQLVNADAFQIYRGFDIGTAKPVDRERYELIDVCEPTEQFGVGEWVRAAQEVLERLHKEGRSAVVVGGTGLYVRALFEEYDGLHPPPPAGLREELSRLELPELRQRLLSLNPDAERDVDLSNPTRVRRAIERAESGSRPLSVSLPPFRRFKFAILPDTEAHRAALRQRLEAMLSGGWIDEVSRLIATGSEPNSPAMRAIGYQHIVEYLANRLDRSKLEEEIWRETWRYVRRQKTWLRTEPSLETRPVTKLNEEALREVCGSICESLALDREGFDG